MTREEKQRQHEAYQVGVFHGICLIVGIAFICIIIARTLV